MYSRSNLICIRKINAKYLEYLQNVTLFNRKVYKGLHKICKKVIVVYLRE